MTEKYCFTTQLEHYGKVTEEDVRKCLYHFVSARVYGDEEMISVRSDNIDYLVRIIRLKDDNVVEIEGNYKYNGDMVKFTRELRIDPDSYYCTEHIELMCKLVSNLDFMNLIEDKDGGNIYVIDHQDCKNIRMIAEMICELALK